MIGAIPNPRKTITIDFPIEKVKVAARNIDKVMKFCHFQEENDMFNSYKFSRNEFLSLGAFININLNSVSENKTQIDVEISRKLGAFDEWVEVQKANKHIEETINSIAQIIKNGVPEVKTETKKTTPPPERILNLRGKIAAFILWCVVAAVAGQTLKDTTLGVFSLCWLLIGWTIPVLLVTPMQFFTKPNPDFVQVN